MDLTNDKVRIITNVLNWGTQESTKLLFKVYDLKVNLSYEILDRKRRAILPNFKSFKNDFYLAGGTAFAGHDLKKLRKKKIP